MALMVAKVYANRTEVQAVFLIFPELSMAFHADPVGSAITTGAIRLPPLTCTRHMWRISSS